MESICNLFLKWTSKSAESFFEMWKVGLIPTL